MRAEILSYSRSRGVFAGVSLEGSTIRPDDDASEDVYGHPIKAKDIVRGEHVGVPGTGRHLVNALQRSAPINESERASNASSRKSKAMTLSGPLPSRQVCGFKEPALTVVRAPSEP
jgi:hypothetical protein